MKKEKFGQYIQAAAEEIYLYEVAGVEKFIAM